MNYTRKSLFFTNFWTNFWILYELNLGYIFDPDMKICVTAVEMKCGIRLTDILGARNLCRNLWHIIYRIRKLYCFSNLWSSFGYHMH
jgi:hypothetical protein